MRSSLPEKREEPRFRRAIRSKKRQQPLPLVGGNGKRNGTDTAARRTSRFVTPTKVRPLTGPSAQLPYFSERPQMKGLGDDHRGPAQGQPDEKHRQEPADPFLPRDLEDAQGGHEIALRGDENIIRLESARINILKRGGW